MADHKRMEFDRLADLMALSPEEFARFLPDFVAWFEFSKAMQELGGQVQNMTWIDDGRPGEVSRVQLTAKDTGEVTEIVMPGFEPVPPETPHG